MPYREIDPPRPTWEFLFVADPAASFRWSRHFPRWSSLDRLTAGAILSLFSFLPLASLTLAYSDAWKGLPSSFNNPGAFFIFANLIGFVLWGTADLRFFFSRERLEGMRFMDQTIEIGDAVAIDGRTIGLRAEARAACFCFLDYVTRGGKSSALYPQNTWSVCLVHAGTVYELDRTLVEDAARDAAEKLSLALGGTGVIEREVGSQPWRGMREGPLLFAVLQFMLVLFVWVGRGFPRPWLALTILLSMLLVRLAMDSVQLAKCNGIEPERFERLFGGATPVRPLPWLTERRARRFRRVAWLLFVAAVIGGAFDHVVRIT